MPITRLLRRLRPDTVLGLGLLALAAALVFRSRSARSLPSASSRAFVPVASDQDRSTSSVVELRRPTSATDHPSARLAPTTDPTTDPATSEAQEDRPSTRADDEVADRQPQDTHAFRQVDIDAPIVISIDDFDTDPSVLIGEVASVTDWPVPKFNPGHHHHF